MKLFTESFITGDTVSDVHGGTHQNHTVSTTLGKYNLIPVNPGQSVDVHTFSWKLTFHGADFAEDDADATRIIAFLGTRDRGQYEAKDWAIGEIKLFEKHTAESMTIDTIEVQLEELLIVGRSMIDCFRSHTQRDDRESRWEDFDSALGNLEATKSKLEDL